MWEDPYSAATQGGTGEALKAAWDDLFQGASWTSHTLYHLFPPPNKSFKQNLCTMSWCFTQSATWIEASPSRKCSCLYLMGVKIGELENWRGCGCCFPNRLLYILKATYSLTFKVDKDSPVGLLRDWSERFCPSWAQILKHTPVNLKQEVCILMTLPHAG